MKFWRINSILVFFLLFGVAIISQLFSIQIIKGEQYRAMSYGLDQIGEEYQGDRGEIFFKNNEPLAINKESFYVYASPKEIENKEETAIKLAEIFSLESSLILEKINNETSYIELKKKLTDEEVERTKNLNLDGIYLKKESRRYYPQETLASKAIGFMDANRNGQYGLEEYYNETLKSKRGNAGSDLFLTIDYSIQYTVEKFLEKAEKKESENGLEIEGGEIIIIEPSTGRILALASVPSFNPNSYSEIKDLSIFQNSSTQKMFEPGSVFKAITMAIALQENKVTPDTTYIDSGVVQIGKIPINNYGNRSHGEITMTQVLEKSVNTGAVFAEQQVPHETFLNYLNQFGVFDPTGVDLSEVSSENKELKKGYEINFANASFGQGIEMTPMQLIRAYCAIANGGKLVKPYLVEKIKEGDKITEIAPEVSFNQIISPKTVSQLTAMLVSVIENGYSKAGKVSGYYVAGKSGTAQVSFSALGRNQKGYSDKTWQSFIGFAPAFNPRFLILVKLDNPKTKTAEYSALPIFHDLVKYLIDYYQIPPDYQQ